MLPILRPNLRAGRVELQVLNKHENENEKQAQGRLGSHTAAPPGPLTKHQNHTAGLNKPKLLDRFINSTRR